MFSITRKLPRLSTIYLLATLCLTAWVAFGRPSPQPQPAVASGRATTVLPSASPKPRSRIIEIGDAQLGQRTLGKNPIREQVEPIDPDPKTWRKISLEMRKDNGLRLRVELLRSLDWMADYEAAVGGTIFLDLDEMGALGDATVTSIEPCPPIALGTGAIITGKFVHESDGQNVVELRIEGQAEPTTVTDNHPYWSTDRQDFVPVSELRKGELLDTESGHRQVVSVVPRPNYSGLLYNVETTEHVYRVGILGSLVHNTCTRVYRVIRDDENINVGIFAKRPGFTHPGGVNSHVLHGGRKDFSGDTWISTTKSLDRAKEIQAKFGGRIVEIDLNMAKGQVQHVIDLTDDTVRSKQLKGRMATNFAKYYEEVLIEGWIPPQAIKVP